LLTDVSASIEAVRGEQQTSDLLENFRNSSELLDRFDLEQFAIAEKLTALDSLAYTGEVSNLAKGVKGLENLFIKEKVATVMISDGHQTQGQDYEYVELPEKMGLYTLTVGDTTQYRDLALGRIQLNPYAFLDNRFPIEGYVHYKGKGSARSNLEIWVDGKRTFSETLAFDAVKNTVKIQTDIKAERIGILPISVRLRPLENERNTQNNQRQLAIEVVDERVKVLFCSTMLHPDMGALKKGIEKNGQRTFEFLDLRKPLAGGQVPEADLYILYQPNRSFTQLYTYLKNSNANLFTITGPKTDWGFLNQIQSAFQKTTLGANEETIPVKNGGFSFFAADSWSLERYPPLETELGETIIHREHEQLLEQQVKGGLIGEPLLATLMGNENREAVLFGEGIWKWRMQDYRNQGNFEGFDGLMDKLVGFLTANKSKTRLSVDYQNVFRGAREALITAKYFDNTFVFDAKASLSLKLTGNGAETEIPMVLKGNFYEADLRQLAVGDYTFSVENKKEGLIKSGAFTILPFNLEQQQLSADFGKMQRFADYNNGMAFLPDQFEQLKAELLQNDRWLRLKKSQEKEVSLIGFNWLLALVALCLCLEWLIRKYNGYL